MFERLFGRIRISFPFLSEKARGKDFQQVEVLPAHLRSNYIHGNEEEADQALQEIIKLQNAGEFSLGPAALDLLQELRAFQQQICSSRAQKP